jgi:hypothetical protein
MNMLFQAILRWRPWFQADQDRDHIPGLHRQSAKIDTAYTLTGGSALAQGNDLDGLTLR